MVKLRSHHQRNNKKPLAFWGRIVLMLVLILILWYLGRMLTGGFRGEEVNYADHGHDTCRHAAWVTGYKDLQVVDHLYFSLGYSEKHEQAAWIAYDLKRSELKLPNVPRTDWFEADPSVATGSAEYRDYSGSGYSRGHLAPAGDMAFSSRAMEESFFMSNMSPQDPVFNRGIWRELEESVRDWAFSLERLYIVTGPVLKNPKGTIGQTSRVTVPAAFYKAILDAESPDLKGIGFVIPNEVSDRPLYDYAVSIDEVEALTGLEFFDVLLNDEYESMVEEKLDTKQWPLDEGRFQRRINSWNNQY